MGEVVGVVGGCVVEGLELLSCKMWLVDFARPKGGKKLTGRPPRPRAALRAGSRTQRTPASHSKAPRELRYVPAWR